MVAAATVRNASYALIAALVFAESMGAQATGTPPATPPAARPTPTLPPAIAAMNKANAIKDPAERLAALEKVRVDFSYPQVDPTILRTLATSFPDRTEEIRSVFERIVERVPATPLDSRLTQLQTPIMSVMNAKSKLLDRSEQLLTETLAAFTYDVYATSRREIAQRVNQAAPTDASLKTAYGNARSRGLETLGRLYMLKSDTTRGEATFKEAITVSSGYSVATSALVDLYMARNDFPSAERLLLESIAAASAPPSPQVPTAPGETRVLTSPVVISGGTTMSGVTIPMMSLAGLYEKRGEDKKAEDLYAEVLKKSPTTKNALVAIARLENKRGEKKGALDHFLAGSVQGPIATADDSLMRALYRSSRGATADIDSEIDSLYRVQFPNPVKVDHYEPPSSRSDRVVMLEMFTGSGCAPCVSADLALDAVMERYPQDAIIAVNYHANIPAPDPMVVAGGDTRRLYYQVRGVPTFNVDGALGQLGGGARTAAQGTYSRYTSVIDRALSTPARAALEVSATGSGNEIMVSVNVDKLALDQKDLRLHILLVERDLRYAGENGIRFHPMVVRAVAGDRGMGIPITSNTTAKYAFKLDAIRMDVEATLAAEIAKRRSASTSTATYAAENKAYTKINPMQLVAVAFIQQGPYYPDGAPVQAAGFETIGDDEPAKVVTPGVAGPNILQAAKANVVYKK